MPVPSASSTSSSSISSTSNLSICSSVCVSKMFCCCGVISKVVNAADGLGAVASITVMGAADAAGDTGGAGSMGCVAVCGAAGGVARAPDADPASSLARLAFQ